MVRRLNGRHAWLVACAALVALAIALPAAAQSTGMVRGVVKDASGKPVEGAKIIVEAEGNNRHFETKSDKKGEFIQIGLPPGPYKVTAEKDKTSPMSAPSAVNVRVAPGAPLTLVIVRGGGGGLAGSGREERRAEEDLRRRRRRQPRGQSRRGDREVHARRGAQPDLLRLLLQHRLLAGAEEGLRQGGSGLQEGDRAEGRLRRGLQRPGQHLQRAAQVRRGGGRPARRRWSSARAALPAGPAAATPTRCSTRASSSGTRARSPRRRSSSKAAIAANPNHAEAHYQLGMALVNEGNLAGAGAEFETYLKLAPTGPNAATAKGILATLKK